MESETGSKNFFIQTFGCQMNIADTERIAVLLSEAGYHEAKTVETADVLLINGCSVRDKAVHKAVSALGRFKNLKTLDGEKPVIGLGGCVGQFEKDRLFKSAPYLDFVFGPDAIDQLPEILHQVERGKRHILFTDFDRSQNYSTETRLFYSKSQAFVNIMKGCDKFCSYCIVPFTRGREKSRTIDEVLDDLGQLVTHGVKEVTLLGQNVNSFGKGNPNLKLREPKELHSPIGKVGPREGEENFPQLLRAIDQDPRLETLRRVRFTSSHPLDFSDELIECYRPVAEGGLRKLARQLHLPIQSGSNSVLNRMGRRHKVEHYIDQMRTLRRLCPDVGISSDLIVGFPNETEADFQATLRLCDEMQYDHIFAFSYSSRPGTRAAKLEDNIPEAEKNRRLNELLDYQKEISAKRYSSRVGKIYEILVEGESKSQKMRTGILGSEKARVWTGRTECNCIVHFVSKLPRDYAGELISVEIIRSTPLALYGRMKRAERSLH